MLIIIKECDDLKKKLIFLEIEEIKYKYENIRLNK